MRFLFTFESSVETVSSTTRVDGCFVFQVMDEDDITAAWKKETQQSRAILHGLT